jgi:hypothetical protein
MEHLFLHSPLWKQLVSCLYLLEELADDAGSCRERLSAPYGALAGSSLPDTQHLRALGNARISVYREGSSRH